MERRSKEQMTGWLYSVDREGGHILSIVSERGSVSQSSYLSSNIRPSFTPSTVLNYCNYKFDMDDGCNASGKSNNSDDNNNNNPWKPLNP
ncbi:hypothetical protein JHK87_023939 [Glycine soja]|nr:hypothetical protein JHK87_023939 [Glycine soja]